MPMLDLVDRIEEERERLDQQVVEGMRDIDFFSEGGEEQITLYPEVIGWDDIIDRLPRGSGPAYNRLRELLLHPYEVAYMAAVAEFFPGQEKEALQQMSELLPTQGDWVESFEARDYFLMQKGLYERRLESGTEHFLSILRNGMPNSNTRPPRRRHGQKTQFPAFVHRGEPVDHL